jgi:hypothetical protein
MRITAFESLELHRYFFSTSHTQMQKSEVQISETYVPTTYSLPMVVVARPSVPDGIVKNITDLRNVFFSNSLEISNPDYSFSLDKEKGYLEICQMLWEWLSTVGVNQHFEYHVGHAWEIKKYWEGWATYGRMLMLCPCCELCDVVCRNCILLDFWGGYTIIENQGGNYYPCVDNPTSPYKVFSKSTDKQKVIEASKEIVEFCKILLKEKYA